MTHVESATPTPIPPHAREHSRALVEHPFQRHCGLEILDQAPGRCRTRLRVAPAPGALPEYFFEGTEADAAAAGPVLDALDHLLALYHVRHAELVAQLADLARREAEAAEQARLAAEAPAQPRHEKVYFWKIR